MPQFDLIFFSLFAALFFAIFLLYFFVFMQQYFSSFFQTKKFSKSFVHQHLLINTIENETRILKALRISWIKKKILEFYDN